MSRPDANPEAHEPGMSNGEPEYELRTGGAKGATLALAFCVAAFAGMAIVAGAANSTETSAKSGGARLIDRNVADIDGHVVTARDLAFWVWMERLRAPEIEQAADSLLAPEVLRNLADEILMSHWATESVKEVSEDDVDQATEQSVSEFRRLAPTQSGFDDWLAESGFDMDTVRRQIRERERRIWLIRNALALRHNVRETRLEGSEQTETEKTERPLRIHLRQILLSCPTRADDRETSRVLLRALSIRRETLGGMPFTDAARLYSDDRGTRESGGELGWVAVKNLNAHLRDAVVGLKRGDVSEPVRTRQGWHLLQVVDLETPTALDLLGRVKTAYNKTLNEMRGDRVVRVAEGYSIAPPRADEPAEGEEGADDPGTGGAETAP